MSEVPFSWLVFGDFTLATERGKTLEGKLAANPVVRCIFSVKTDLISSMSPPVNQLGSLVQRQGHEPSMASLPQTLLIVFIGTQLAMFSGDLTALCTLCLDSCN